MAAGRKYGNLPDIDAAAPDVYETPELADDVSTLPGTSAISPSEASDANDTSDDGIDNRRVQAQYARSRFQPSRVDAKDVDFSDRLNLNQRSYRSYTARRHPGFYDDKVIYGSDSSDDEEEDLDSKLFRLRREVEHIKSTLAQSKNGSPQASDQGIQDAEKISEALEAISLERRGTTRGPEAELVHTIRIISNGNKDESSSEVSAAPTLKAASSSVDSTQGLQLLSRLAEFDSRLTSLECGLGLDAASLPDGGNGTTKPILPTLYNLEKVIAAALAQPTVLEAAQAKTALLLKDAERLARLQAEAKSQSSTAPSASGRDGGIDESADQESKINALYGTLPSIDALSPTIPLLLDRLRSLRILHTSAAMAHATIEDIERQQQEQGGDIKQWREALEQVARHLETGETTLLGNMQKMGGMIKDLERRVAESS